ncbi:DUF4192 domain-containing protein [Mumia sp. zg.B53]|uniref:DUF4192 domain-containing protein n=2 Tax=Mumia TaxID=1546255 RepID=UPI001C6E099C|nr:MULTISPECIES: DUF4192 domain-containing protein [unclassified Mumia]MBW9211540.1 DUF4192 domain-containing protein [Mumia sp. zg.B21]MBW9216713.1 DUF4192 domain-containing protein [Mumia sp. zg.B53]
MTDVMRARTLSDLIGVVPVLLGFHPRDSLVAVCLDGPAGRAGFRLRVDLPPPEAAELAADQLVGYLLRQDPDAVALIAYADTDLDEGARALTDAMTRLLRADGVHVTDAVRYDGTRYYSYSCQDPTCCPREGVPCDVSSSPLLAEAVFRGHEVLSDRDDLVRRFAPVSGRALEEAQRATEREVQGLGRVGAHGAAQRDAETVRRGLARVLPVVDAALGAGPGGPATGGGGSGSGHRLVPDDVAALSVWTSLVVVRDVLWSRITPANALASLTMWREVAVSAVAPFQAAPLTLAAFAAWLAGDGAQAQCALDRVAEVAPRYSMAALVQQALTECLDPAHWEGFDTDDVLRTVPGLS